MSARKRRSYTAEYKVEAAHRMIDTGRTIAEVARELGIDPGMFIVWVKDERRRTEAATAVGNDPCRPRSKPNSRRCADESPIRTTTSRS
jgi:transposase